MGLGTSFTVNCLNSERDTGRENYLLELTSTRLARTLNHEPPSISFYPFLVQIMTNLDALGQDPYLREHLHWYT